MSIVRNFNLYLNAGNGSAPYINVNQYDQGEQWVFTLYKEDGTKYTPSTGAIVGIKADNRGIINTGTVDADGRVVITETQQMTAAAGIAIFELLIDGDTHGTANFLVNVEQRPADNADLSDSDLSLIQQAVDSAEVIVEVIGDSDPSEVIGEHVDDWLDNHPEATTTVQDGAITAPKINNSLWDKILVNEEASGNPASFDDGADDVPVSSLKVNLEPIQTGSGDPSPSNVRPIIAANGKNLLQNTGTSKTENGITWTLNADGSVKCVGTSTGNSLFVVNTFNFESDKTYILTGCPSGGATSTKWQIQILADLSGGATKVETGTGETISGLSGQYYVRLVVRSGNTVDFTWYPMIRLASIADSTYQPYQGIMVERTGKNLCDWNINATSSALSISLPAGNYYISASTTISAGAWYIRATDSNGQYSYSSADIGKTGWPKAGSGWSYGGQDEQGIPFTVPNGCKLIEIGKLNANGTIPAMLNSGNTAIEYEPYTGTSYPYTLGQTVYGGSVDLATGVLTINRVLVTVSDLSITWSASNHIAYGYLTGKKIGRTNLWSNMYKTVNKNYTNMVSGEISGTQGDTGFNIRNDACNSKDEFISANADLQIMYELATPTTIQLTPQEVKTLLGYNNISSSGTVDVIYHADTKLYVDKMTAVDNAIIAPTEEDFTATRNYTVNELVIVNDTLYKVTANIATGSAITPNSNVTQTTLSALIKALS